jgi:hypothetical protein
MMQENDVHKAEENCFAVAVDRICKIPGRDAIQNAPPSPNCSSRPAQGSTQPPIQWIPVLFPQVKAAGA